MFLGWKEVTVLGKWVKQVMKFPLWSLGQNFTLAASVALKEKKSFTLETKHHPLSDAEGQNLNFQPGNYDLDRKQNSLGISDPSHWQTLRRGAIPVEITPLPPPPPSSRKRRAQGRQLLLRSLLWSQKTHPPSRCEQSPAATLAS